MGQMVFTLASVAIGAVFGWAASWLAYSWEEHPTDEVAVWHPMRCTGCHREVRPLHLAPVWSWIGAGRRCRMCRTLRPIGVTLVQAAVIAGFGATAAVRGPAMGTVAIMVAIPTLVLASAIDLRLFLIPRAVVWIGFAASLSAIGVVSALAGHPGWVLRALIGAALYFGLLFAANLIHPAGLGFGDVRLSALLGLYLGWFDPKFVFVGLFISCMLGVVMGLVALRRSGESAFPFGPALALGTTLVLLTDGPLARILH